MIAITFAILAGVIHLYIFCLESLLWGKPSTHRIFRLSAEMAEYNRLFAFNQGFYNLFLAGAVFVGLFLGLQSPIGKTLVSYGLMSMLLAAVVLVFSNRKLLRPALIQGLPPLGSLIFIFL